LHTSRTATLDFSPQLLPYRTFAFTSLDTTQHLHSLKGKNAIVTGASAGIGQATARLLAANGVNVILAARRLSRLEALAAEINAGTAGRALPVAADMAVDVQMEHLVKTGRDAFGPIDILINNAGFGAISPVSSLQMDLLDSIMRVNFRSPVFLSKLVLPEMLERRSGAIINIGSVSSKHGWSSGTPYVSSKFALRGFTQCLAEEVRHHGIRVIGVYPDFVASEFFTAAGKKLPAETLAIPPMDVAAAILSALNMDPRTTVLEIDLAPTSMNPSS
jgi:3-oxoacyl-[acyl-carrier protein] reductase